MSHRGCSRWICYCYLWFSLAQRPQHKALVARASCLWVGIHNSRFYMRIHSESVSPPFFLLHHWQLRDIFVLSYHSSWQGHVYGTRSVNLSLNLAAPSCVSPPLTRKGKVLETCEDALVGVWFLEQCWSDAIKTMVLLETLTFSTGSKRGRKFSKSDIAIYLIWRLKQTWNDKHFSKESLLLKWKVDGLCAISLPLIVLKRVSVWLSKYVNLGYLQGAILCL